MAGTRAVTISLLVMASLCPAVAGQRTGKAAETAKPKQPAQQRPQAQQQRTQAQANPDLRPGAGEQVRKLASMTPEEREQVLSRLPPARRAQLEQGIRNFQKLPPLQQERNIERAERLSRLPPQKQTQVRRAIKQLADIPEDRKLAINQELRHMTAMPDEERRAYMNTEEFRNKYSPTEQQMMGNLAEILPARD